MATAAPWIFVLLWSTGFVVAHYGTEDAGPLTFLAIRLALAAAILGGIALVTGAPRPTGGQSGWASVAGLGIHALYLGGVFLAISWGMASGISALIAGLHPVVTAVVGTVLLGEGLRRRQWLGVGLGFAGVAVVVVDKLGNGSAGISTGALIASGLSVVGMSAGTILQRRRGVHTPLLWGTTVQYLVAGAVLAVGAMVHSALGGHEGFTVTHQSVFALVWAVGVLSIAAVLIMMWLLKHHAAATVGSLFFLTPALSTAEGAVLFGERLGPLALLGLFVALIGVALTLRAAPR